MTTQENAAQWVVENGESYGLPARVLRAAREGRNVVTELKDAAAAKVLAAIHAAVPAELAKRGIGATPDTYQTCDADSRVPSDDAYALYDALRAAASAIADACGLPGARATIEHFTRVDLCPHAGETAWRGAVDVEVRCDLLPGYDFGAQVLTEPEEYVDET